MNTGIYAAILWTVVTGFRVPDITQTVVLFETKADCEAMVDAHVRQDVVDWKEKQDLGIPGSTFTVKGECKEIRKP